MTAPQPTACDWARVERVLRVTSGPVSRPDEGVVGDLLCVLQHDVLSMLIEQREGLLREFVALADHWRAANGALVPQWVEDDVRELVARLRGDHG